MNLYFTSDMCNCPDLFNTAMENNAGDVSCIVKKQFKITANVYKVVIFPLSTQMFFFLFVSRMFTVTASTERNLFNVL